MTILHKTRWALTALATGLLFAAVAPMPASADVTMTATCTARGDGSAVVSGTVSGSFEGFPTGWVAAWGMPPPTDPPPMVQPPWMVYASEPFTGEGPFEMTTGPEAGIQAGSSINVGAFPAEAPAPDPNLYKPLGSASVTCVALERTVTDVVTDLVGNGVLHQSEANALLVKVDAATGSANRGTIRAAINQLGALKQQVDAMSTSGRLTQQQHDDLVAAADRMIADLT